MDSSELTPKVTAENNSNCQFSKDCKNIQTSLKKSSAFALFPDENVNEQPSDTKAIFGAQFSRLQTF